MSSGETVRAAHRAIWLAIQLVAAGEIGQASGWRGRAQRLVEREGRECVEQGYLLLPIMFEHEASGDLDSAIATAAAALDGRGRDPEAAVTPNIGLLADHCRFHVAGERPAEFRTTRSPDDANWPAAPN